MSLNLFLVVYVCYYLKNTVLQAKQTFFFLAGRSICTVSGFFRGTDIMTLVLNSTVCQVLNRRFFSQTQSLGIMVARPLVLCGPSGVGKSTIVERIKKAFPNAFALSVSHTTRNPREGEKDGVNYFFTDRETMKKSIDDDEFIETAEFSGNMYGTSKSAVESVIQHGKICILDIVSDQHFKLCHVIKPCRCLTRYKAWRNGLKRSRDSCRLMYLLM